MLKSEHKNKDIDKKFTLLWRSLRNMAAKRMDYAMIEENFACTLRDMYIPVSSEFRGY